LYCLFELGARGTLWQEAGSAFTQGADGVLACFVDRQDDNFNLRVLFSYLVQDFKAAAVRHGDIKQHEVGSELSDEIECFTALAGFAYDEHSIDFFDESPNASAHERVVVSD
jgi:hypothetical protein